MKGEKTAYCFHVSRESRVREIINKWLSYYSFQKMGKNHYSTVGSILLTGKYGWHNFEYVLSDGLLSIKAYLGKNQNEVYSLENQSKGWIDVKKYKEQLEDLFKLLEDYILDDKENNKTEIANIDKGQESANPDIDKDKQKNMNKLIDKIDNNNNLYAVIAFVLSLFLFVCALVNVSLMISICLMALAMFLGVLGLKSNKKGLARASILIIALSFIVSLITLISSLL